jgi:hypothetical protein
MTFKIGDMVRIVAPPNDRYPSDESLIGKAGTIVSATEFVHPEGGQYWQVDVNDSIDTYAAVTQICPRLIPGDPEGRKVVDWNWRDLISKQPALMPQFDPSCLTFTIDRVEA